MLGMAFWLGLYPMTFLSDIDPAVNRTIAAIKEKYAAGAPESPKMLGGAAEGAKAQPGTRE